jgi:hypothetical protein
LGLHVGHGRQRVYQTLQAGELPPQFRQRYQRVGRRGS